LIESLPHVNATLNALATLLLIAGYVQIKQRRESAHKWTMLACFGVSIVFLACYLTHHWYLKYVVDLPYGSHLFPKEYAVARVIYLTVLIPHVILAATVPFLALATIYLGFADRRKAHRRLAIWTFPIWLYVSITGVVVYFMRYQLYPPT
jgi:putative membrane protein